MARKRGNWRDRVVAVLRAAAEIKRSPRYGAAKIGERDDKIIDMATREVERVELELIEADPLVSDPMRFTRAVGIAAERLAAAPDREPPAAPPAEGAQP